MISWFSLKSFRSRPVIWLYQTIFDQGIVGHLVETPNHNYTYNKCSCKPPKQNEYLKFHTQISAGTKCEKIFNDVVVSYFTNLDSTDLATALANVFGTGGTMLLTALEETVGLGLDDLVGLQQTVVNGLDVKLLCKAAGQILEAWVLNLLTSFDILFLQNCAILNTLCIEKS